MNNHKYYYYAYSTRNCKLIRPSLNRLRTVYKKVLLDIAFNSLGEFCDVGKFL